MKPTKNIEQILKLKLDYYINFKKRQLIKNQYNPDDNNIKYLVLFASHCDSEIKLHAIKNNLQYFDHNSMDVIVINSTNLKYNTDVKNICESYRNITYCEIENIPTLDFGKWINVLDRYNYNKYDFIFFTNDSFIIHNPINYFFNLTYKYNLDLYGYNDSTQRKYHYQSYLFALKKNVISRFIFEVNLKIHKIKGYEDVVTEYELNMTTWFNKIDCFLSIGYIPSHKGLNIFFTNDLLYDKLKKNLLPFTKIKRLLKDESKK